MRSRAAATSTLGVPADETGPGRCPREEAAIATDPCDEGLRAAGVTVLSVLAGALGGGLLGSGAVLLDRVVDVGVVAEPAAAEATLAAIVTALVTLAIFTVWMRSVVVALAANQFSPRIVAGAMADTFQRHALTGAVLLVTAAFTLAVRIPTGELDGAPAASLALAITLVLAGLLGVLHALRSWVASLAMTSIVRDLTRTAIAAIERHGGADDTVPDVRGPTRATVRAGELGWVRSIDRPRILASLPAGATADLRVDIGSLVAEGDVLVELDADAVDDDAIRRAVDVRATRCPHVDVAFALQQLGDVAAHALQPSSMDGSTALEAVQHLGIALERLLRGGVPTGCLVDDGRAVVAGARWSVSDHLQQLIDPLVVAADRNHVTAGQLDATLVSLEELADEVGDEASTEVLRDQRARIRTGQGWPDGERLSRPTPSRRRQPPGTAVDVRS